MMLSNLLKAQKELMSHLTLKKVDGTIEDITIKRDIVELGETYAKSSTVIKDGKRSMELLICQSFM